MLKKMAILITISALATSCSNDGSISKTNVGTGLGVIGGALLGSTIGKGEGRVVGMAIGAALGGLAGHSIGEYMDKEDVKKHKLAEEEALEENQDGVSLPWGSKKRGAYGEVTPVKTYKKEGRYCREFQQTVTVAGKTQQAYGTACRQPDGTWEIMN